VERSRIVTEWLLAAGAKLIVVACNTATSLAIDVLRAAYPQIPFVGMEPAVKPAAGAKRIGVLATAATLNSKRYQNLRQRYLPNRPVLEDPCRGLVSLIEERGASTPAVRAHLKPILAPMLAAEVDALVLGCTHYPLVRADIEAIAGPAVTVIDPAPAAARQVKRLLREHRLEAGRVETLLPNPSPASCVRAHIFCTTGPSIALQRTLLILPELNARRKLLVPKVALR
ncbi:MAG: aspartate/glutamate racemase family protein, partial [Bacteroidota bacterium]